MVQTLNPSAAAAHGAHTRPEPPAGYGAVDGARTHRSECIHLFDTATPLRD